MSDGNCRTWMYNTTVRQELICRVHQRFVPIVNCIFRKAFNTSLGKCNWFTYEIFLNNRSKQFQTKIWTKYNIFLLFAPECMHASFFPTIFFCPFCRFSIFVFLPFSFVSSTLSRKWRHTLFLLQLRHLFLRYSGHLVKEITKLLKTTERCMSEQVVKSKNVTRQTKE